MKKRAFRVGIFDSGIGGLTVLAACAARVPYARYYYYGDNARAPYGGRSEEEILSFTREACDFFLKHKVDAVVLACNTATACALGEIRREYPFPVIGMEPAVKPAAECKKVLVLATERTAESARMKMLLSRFPNCDFTLHACLHLAGAIEKYYTEGEPFLLSAHLPEGNFDGVVLGCSHYSYFASEIAARYHAKVFDGGEGVAKRLEFVLNSLAAGNSAHPISEQKANVCFSFRARKRIFFVGNSRELNKKVYFRTFVLDKTQKNKNFPKKVEKSG